MIDFKFENSDPLIIGSILISEPFLSDDYFSRSVIFLCDHNEQGSFGFVLNKYIDNDLSTMIEDFPDGETKISVGGPVETSSLFYLHDLGAEIPGSIETARGLFIGGDFEEVKNVLRLNPEKASKIRFFVGYSGWSEGQLKSELDQKDWIVVNDISPEQILDTSNDNIWKEIMENLGGKFKMMSKFPKNPSNN